MFNFKQDKLAIAYLIAKRRRRVLKKQIKISVLMISLFMLSQAVTGHAYESDRYMLIPGGDAVGIHIQTEGLIVVDTYTVETECGQFSPGAEAGLIKGDLIVAINGQPVRHIEEYKEALIAHEGLLKLTVSRDGQNADVVITGCRNSQGELTTGLYLRNQIAGIGTLTYVDPTSSKYGALGHEIIDQDTQEIVNIHSGELIDSDITSIRKATDGNPGEKIADIYFDECHGTIEKNNEYGIYGQLTTDHFKVKGVMPIAYREEVQVGPATIYTVLNGQIIEEFAIEIVEVESQDFKEIKGIKYVVTDERLIEATGGIVQGMSGSPIIQNGKIIGAVTHVLVHDSTLGYGVFIEWMLEESGIDYKAQQIIQTSRPAA